MWPITLGLDGTTKRLVVLLSRKTAPGIFLKPYICILSSDQNAPPQSYNRGGEAKSNCKYKEQKRNCLEGITTESPCRTPSSYCNDVRLELVTLLLLGGEGGICMVQNALVGVVTHVFTHYFIPICNFLYSVSHPS